MEGPEVVLLLKWILCILGDTLLKRHVSKSLNHIMEKCGLDSEVTFVCVRR